MFNELHNQYSFLGVRVGDPISKYLAEKVRMARLRNKKGESKGNNDGAWRQNKSVVAPVVVGPEVP
jgi:hypothetical protein